MAGLSDLSGLSAPVEAFLAAMRRRLRLVWAWATLSLLAPFVAAAALLLAALGWLAPWAWPDPAALGVALATMAGVPAWAMVRRLDAPAVARAADRGLRTADGFGAAVCFRGLEDPFGSRVRLRAEALAATASAPHAVPLRPHWRRWGLSAVLAAVAAVLAFGPNPQDQRRAERELVVQQLEAEAETLDELAEELSTPDAESSLQAQGTPTAEALRAAAEQLRSASSLEEARQALQQSIDDLAASRPGDFAARRAAASGLQRSLQARPLGSESGTAAQQLAGAAESLAGLGAGERAELAERLESLAETQSAGNPELAEALSEAASGISGGDLGAAATALAAASGAQQSMTDAVASQLDADSAAQALAAAAQRLSQQPGTGAGGSQDAGQGSGQGQAEGQGQGSGQGQGQGQGSGQGAGQGQGQGSGGGGGSAQGQVAGAEGGIGGQAQGGQGRPGGTDQSRTEYDAPPTIVDPETLIDGEDVSLGGQPGGDAAEVIGTGDGPTSAGLAQVPLADLVAEYSARASTALSSSSLPPSSRRLVGSYFDTLASAS